MMRTGHPAVCAAHSGEASSHAHARVDADHLMTCTAPDLLSINRFRGPVYGIDNIGDSEQRPSMSNKLIQWPCVDQEPVWVPNSNGRSQR